jgi:hypothetical protein
MTTADDLDRRIQQLKDARLKKEVRRGKGLLELLDKRPELREVIPLADMTGEGLLWSA